MAMASSLGLPSHGLHVGHGRAAAATSPCPGQNPRTGAGWLAACSTPAIAASHRKAGKRRHQFVARRQQEPQRESQSSPGQDEGCEVDLCKFQQFVMGSELHKLAGKDLVPVVGFTGAGKSTLIAIQLGADSEARGSVFELDKGKADNLPEISHGSLSQTLNAKGYEVKLPNGQVITLTDTGGFKDNRGPNEKMWVTFGIAKILSLADSIPAMIVVCDFHMLFGTRSSGVRELTELLKHQIGTNNALYDSMVFVFSNPLLQGRPAKVRDAQRRAKERKQECKSLLKKKVGVSMPELISPKASTLKKNWLAGISGILPWPRDKEEPELEKIEEIEMSRDMSPQGQEQADKLLAEIGMLAAVEKACKDGRVFMSHPAGKAKCREQRKEIANIITRCCTPVPNEQLREILKSKRTCGLEVCQAMVSLLMQSGLFELTLKEADLRLKLFDLMEAEQSTLNRISEDWRAVQAEHVRQNQVSKEALLGVADERQQELQSLMSSTTLSVREVEEIRKTPGECVLRDPGTWLNWAWWIEPSARFDYHGLPFVAYETCGDQRIKTEETNMPSKGELELHFKSQVKRQLYLDVMIMDFERNLPASQERMKALQSRIQRLEDEVRQLDFKNYELKKVDSEQDLVDVLLSRKKSIETEMIEQQLQSIDEQLESNTKTTREGEEGQARDVCAALFNFFSVLQATDNLSLDLSQGETRSIREFIKAYEQLQQLTKEESPESEEDISKAEP